MQVILREDVANLGRTGDVVTVRAGYGRNYLIPRQLATQATDRDVRRVEHEKRVIAHRERKQRSKSEKLRERLQALSINIAKKTGEGDRLFGSVTAKDIAAAIAGAAEDAPQLDRKQILIAEPIKSLGVHEVNVKLTRDIQATVKVWVVSGE